MNKSVVLTLTSPASLDNMYLAAIFHGQHWSPFGEICCNVNDICAYNAQQLCESGVNAAHHPI